MLYLAKLTLPENISGCWGNEQDLATVVKREIRGLYYSADFLDLLRGMLKFNIHDRLYIENVRIVVSIFSSRRAAAKT